MLGSRLLLHLTVLFGGAMLWFVPHLPLIDLPQHAAQVAAARDLLLGRSTWTDTLRFNFLTPYLVGYVPGVLLSLVLPVATSLVLLLTAAWWGFFFACVRLRGALGGEPLLDWLFVPGFFGLAFQWGFFTFLVAAPFGIVFLLVALRYSDGGGLRSAMRVLLIGGVLFFCHALVFLFATGVGGLFILQRDGLTRRTLVRLIPYFVLALVAATFFLVFMRSDPAISVQSGAVTNWAFTWARVAKFFVYIWGTRQDWPIAVVGLALFALPIVVRARLQRDARAYAPMTALALCWVAAPTVASSVAFLFDRFAVFTLPVFALMWVPGSEQAAPSTNARRALAAAVPLICASFLGVRLIHFLRFAQESAPFERVIAAARPNERALAMIFDRGSDAANNDAAYMHYALWYQAERGGLVDFNFAWVLPQMVRFRPGRYPAVSPGFEFDPGGHEWKIPADDTYEYVIVRRADMRNFRPPRISSCPVRLLAHEGSWSLFGRVPCPSAAAATG